MGSLGAILTECKLYINNEEIIDGWYNLDKNVIYNISIVANDGFKFEEVPYVNMWDLDITTSDNKTYSGTIKATSNYNDTLTATAVASQETKFKFNIDVSNATTNISPDTDYIVGTPINVTVTANEGYYFATAPTITYYIKGAPQIVMLESDDTNEHKQNFYTTFTCPTDATIVNGITLNGNAQVIPETDKYGIITIYNPTTTELKQIGDVRYMNNVDLGDYITNLIKIFVKIPQGKSANVLLGGYNTNVVSNVVVNDIIETDCGSVEIVGKYDNVMDYENTRIELYLPFIGFVELDTYKVMNETIKLIYKTNVINGDSIACIYNSNDTLLYTFNCNASFQIPYRLNAEIESKGKLNVDSNYLYGFTPFVTIRYNKAYNSANVISDDDRYTTLESEIGFVKCSEVFNTINTTKEEREELDNLMKSGIIL